MPLKSLPLVYKMYSFLFSS